MSPKEECEILLSELLPFGQSLLKKNNEFYPYAAVMNTDSTTKMLAFYDGNEFPDSNELIGSFTKICRQSAENGEIKVSGIAWNGSIAVDNDKKVDAIVVSLEHRAAYSALIALPYKKGLFNKYTFGDITAMEGKRDIF